MSIVNSIELVRGWLEENVCPQVRLKLPDDGATDASYPYELVHPAAFALFIPSKDRTPPGIAAPIPSVCVQIVQGRDDMTAGIRAIRLRLCFAAWDPGLHGPDILKPAGVSAHIRSDDGEALARFQKNGEGWRDAWNFVDTALREIEDAEYLNGLRLVKEEGVTFGLFTEQDAVPDFYPFWYAWAELTVSEGLSRHPRAYDQFL